MSSEKTLVILTPGFPASESDSTCLPMQQNFVRNVKSTYPQLTIVVLTFQYPYHRNAYSWHGIRVIPFNGRNRGGLTKIRLRNEIKTTLGKIHRAAEIVGLLSFWSNECAWIGKKFSDRSKVKHYCWILGQDAKTDNEYPRQLHFRPEELIALSEFLQYEFEKNHGVRPRFVIPPGVDPGLFESAARERDIDVLGVGSLIPLKRYDIFLKVIVEIKKQLPGVKALLLGDGPERERLQSMIRDSGLHKNVELGGERPYAEVLRSMQRSRILLHPSSYEGFSGVCLEALYAGSRVISFCRPMKKEIEHWLVVEDAEQMSAAAVRLLNHHQENYRPAAVFTIDHSVAAIMKLFGFT